MVSAGKMARTNAVRSLVAAVLLLVVLAMPTVVLADSRVALVVGNSTYAHIGRLPNLDNDARAMSAALRTLRFEVKDASGRCRLGVRCAGAPAGPIAASSR